MVKLIQKTLVLASYRNPSHKVKNTKLYTETPLRPRIEIQEYKTSSKIDSSYTYKRGDKGDTLEIFRLPDEIIKIVKNRFGEIKAFKSSIPQHNENPARTYENVKEVMAGKTHNFLG